MTRSTSISPSDESRKRSLYVKNKTHYSEDQEAALQINHAVVPTEVYLRCYAERGLVCRQYSDVHSDVHRQMCTDRCANAVPTAGIRQGIRFLHVGRLVMISCG